MIDFNSLHKIISRRLCRRSIALVQLVVMMMLAVPACCYELALEQGKADVCVSATSAGHDECPCCPGENKSGENKSGAADCSTCGNCSSFAPLTSELVVDYHPSVAPLVSRELVTKLLDVAIPIFVPPQNLA